jgi:type IV pilus assembly protein PilA
MKTNPAPRRPQSGFTLLEILGVVAIIGILAAIAIPSVQKARRNSALTAAVKTVSVVSGAVQQFMQKPGGPGYPPLTEAAATGSFALNSSNAALTGATAAAVSKAATLDSVLLAERTLESPISFGIGSAVNTPTGSVALLWDTANNYFNTSPAAAPTLDHSALARIECQVSTTNAPGDGTNFYLDASNTSLPASSRVVSIVIPGVLGADAAALANLMDNKSSASASAANTSGRVAYAAPSASGTTTVYLYVGHY